jgi:hypothetical protein
MPFARHLLDIGEVHKRPQLLHEPAVPLEQITVG